MTDVILVSREERLLRLRLNRPGKRNALDREMCQELVSRLAEADIDPGVGAVLIEAEGPVFCSGLDLDDILAENAAEDVLLHDRLFNFGEDLSKPVVAAVQGAALAGGMALVANAHVAVAAQGSSFGMTEVRLGLFPYVPFRAVAIALGRRRALELCLTGRIFTAPEALTWGLVHHVAPAFEYDDLALTIAHGLAASSAPAVRGGLALQRTQSSAQPREIRARAVAERQQALQSADLHEGIEAIREKRRPNWPSHGLVPKEPI